MFLDTTTRKLQISLGAAHTTTALSVSVDYVDFTSTATTPGLQLSTTNGTSQVDILSSPASSTQRKVNLITVCNTDSEPAQVTIRLNDNGTTYNYVTSLLLMVGSTLQFTDTRGWFVIDQGGNIQVATGAYIDIQTFSANGNWTKPSAATYVRVDICGAGGAGGGGSSASGTDSSGGGGGGGARRSIGLFLARELTQIVTVTVAAQTPSAPAETDGLAGGNSLFGPYLIAYGGGGGAWQSDTATGAGGGGGGATSAGTSATTNTAVAGGSAIVAGASLTSYASDIGGGGGGINNISPPGSSYFSGGGGAGAMGAAGLTNSFSGGSSFQSAGGGGGGGTFANAVSTAYGGGAGGSSGGSVTGIGGGGAAGAVGANGGNGADGDSTRAGAGGGGGGASSGGLAGSGGNGGVPGGGGGGGGGGLTGGAGGAGGAGRCVVYSW